jgi:SAM-dependent methyltransferase
MKYTPSEFDIKALEIIRASVDVIVQQAAHQHNYPGQKVLDVAPQGKEYAKKIFDRSKYETLDIEKTTLPDYQFDLCAPTRTIPRNLFGRFDAIICCEVLEHVNNPFQAVDNLGCMLKNRGVLYLTTPFNFRIHGPLPDNWRFTEHGLRQLFNQDDGWIIHELTPVNTPDRDLAPIHYRLIAYKL